MWVVKAPHGSGDREIMRREGGSYSHSYLSSYGLPDTLTRARERVGFSGDSVLPGYVTTVDLVFGKGCFVHLALLLLIYFKNTNTHTFQNNKQLARRRSFPQVMTKYLVYMQGIRQRKLSRCDIRWL